MGEVHYMISEAAKRVGVEAHVLRYWRKNLTFRSAGQRWGTVTIQKMTSAYFTASRISKSRACS